MVTFEEFRKLENLDETGEDPLNPTRDSTDLDIYLQFIKVIAYQR